MKTKIETVLSDFGGSKKASHPFILVNFSQVLGLKKSFSTLFFWNGMKVGK